LLLDRSGIRALDAEPKWLAGTAANGNAAPVRTSIALSKVESMSEIAEPAPNATDRANLRIIEGPLTTGLFKLGLPLALAMALQSTFNLIDMLVVSRLPDGKEAVAALAICDLVAMVPTILANGISNASAAIIARRAGERDARAVSFFTWQSLALVTWLSVGFGLVGGLFATPITEGVFGAKGHMATLTVEYMTVIVGGCFSILLLLQIAAIMRALGDGKTPLILLVGSNVVNLFMTIVMVYGNGPAPEGLQWATPIADAIGLEPMGVLGAAWSTIISRLLALAIGAVILARKSALVTFHMKDLRLTRRAFNQLWRIAWPNSAQFVLRIGVILFFTAIITRHFTTAEDATTATAFGICTRLETMVLFMSMGWGAAASTYVGQNLGAGFGKRAMDAGWIASGYNFVFMIGILMSFLFASDAIIGIFNDSPSVIAVGEEYLRIVGASYLFFGVAVVISQALAGAGATMAGFTIDSFVLLALVIPASLIAIAATDITQTLTWSLIAGGNVVTGIVYVAWFKRGRWLTHQV
jgi:putative MATE family efflux protein